MGGYEDFLHLAFAKKTPLRDSAFVPFSPPEEYNVMPSSFENSKVFKEHFHSSGEVLVGNVSANGEGAATFFFLRLRYKDGIILLPRGSLCREEVEDLRTVVPDGDVEVTEIKIHEVKDVPPAFVGLKGIPKIRTLRSRKSRC